MTDYEKLVDDIKKYTKGKIKKSRYEHSKRVADMCVTLCKLSGLDEKSGYLVGIGHDMCKDFSDDELFELSAKDGNPIIDYERRKPAILHGRAAAVMLRDKFGIKDKDILEAVECHTSGKIGMCDLAKCLFIADKIEPGRPQSTDAYRARLLSMPLGKMFKAVVEENFNYVFNKGYEIYPGTKEMVDYYTARD